jgi:hypothetical protein
MTSRQAPQLCEDALAPFKLGVLFYRVHPHQCNQLKQRAVNLASDKR